MLKDRSNDFQPEEMDENSIFIILYMDTDIDLVFPQFFKTVALDRDRAMREYFKVYPHYRLVWIADASDVREAYDGFFDRNGMPFSAKYPYPKPDRSDLLESLSEPAEPVHIHFPYLVIFKEVWEEEDAMRSRFECDARDEAHAIEQCQERNPGAENFQVIRKDSDAFALWTHFGMIDK